MVVSNTGADNFHRSVATALVIGTSSRPIPASGEGSVNLANMVARTFGTKGRFHADRVN